MLQVLSGENGFLVSAELKKLVDSFLTQHGDMGLERLDGEEASFERIGGAINSLPFLASKKMVIIKNASKNKVFAEEFKTILKDVPDSTDLIIIEGKLDKRSAYYKYVKKLDGFREFGSSDERSLSNWLVDYAQSINAQLSSSDARYLLARIGNSQQMLASEIDKLANYSQKITKDTINLLCEPTPQSSTFDLLDASLRGNRKRVIQLYQEQRSLRVEPVQIIALLSWQLHILAALVFADGASPDSVARQLKASPYAVKKSAIIAQGLSKTKIRALIGALTELDISIKTKSIDSDDALQLYLLTMAI